VPVKVGLDTTFVVGLLDQRDIWHGAAAELQSGLQSGDCQVFVFDCVLAEVISILARRTHEQRRETGLTLLLQALSEQFPKKAITWLYPDLPQHYDEVLALVEQSAGELNFNDALIALACRERHIPILASFDADFDKVPWLQRAANAAGLSASAARTD
jgi:predicted nucleic acid-binding protein